MHTYLNQRRLFRTSAMNDKSSWITSTIWVKWTIVIKSSPRRELGNRESMAPAKVTQQYRENTHY